MSQWPRSRKIALALFVWSLVVLACLIGDHGGSRKASKPLKARSGPVVAAHVKTPVVVRKAVRTPHRVSRAFVRVAGIAPHTPGMRYAAGLVTGEQWACLSRLWQRESGWSPRSRTGSHFGIAQLRGETSVDAATQVDHGLRYIENRYGSPCAAWAHSQSTGWY